MGWPGVFSRREEEEFSRGQKARWGEGGEEKRVRIGGAV